MNTFIGVDGLIEIATRNGLISYTVAVGPGATGIEGRCILRFSDREETVSADWNEVSYLVSKSDTWKKFPEQMMKVFVTRKAIESLFKEQIAAYISEVLG